LDDVLLTLDDQRQAYLLDAVSGSQALFTVTTQASVPSRQRDAAVFTVDAGTVERVHAHLA
jgi:recombinational DNA repair ATPase RecF